MNERLDSLEAELSAMRPHPLSAALLEGIEAGMVEPSARASRASRASGWPDRFLLSAVASGAMAACVIAAMLLKPAGEAFPSPPSVLVTTPSEPPRAGDYSLVVARAADPAWADELRFSP